MKKPDVVRIVGTERPDGLALRTAGLNEHGLPELSADGLPPYLGQGWARVLGEAARVFAATHDYPMELTLVPDVTVRLWPDQNGGIMLLPPEDYVGGLDAWRRHVVLRLFPEARV
ncbi:hypothetical protein [Actinomadura violacea]|uniref:Uncharacterized protein n=1 Tax=Actinomadura violacea TaxID=2819934 RepID=A0ABS3RPA5_9ACTN|nr:hypothetical protein [Actinomadura violacea]MBO2458577.1 hypothetical protein [Actinomadura violacea]